MDNVRKLGAWKGIIVVAVIAVVLFFGGFFVARSTSASSVSDGRENARYEFMQIGDTVAAIDTRTGETYAIDGTTRAWTLLAPALPNRTQK